MACEQNDIEAGLEARERVAAQKNAEVLHSALGK
eukprot:CAMPEP_0119087398 /NCGR_PEP_ID=MMETSP1178-20130426/141569_1 /TAXON_ID=33656 /ORGANISM="unid sp, Strain CCMP2000" /LENGTH=33 /DNA_ID= /DNA_START= /DNA_END= /DNA_ORIENTATION=